MHDTPYVCRSRVRAIDERWEEVNVRATHTLENIEEDDRDRQDPDRRRKGSGAAAGKRRDGAGVIFSRLVTGRLTSAFFSSASFRSFYKISTYKHTSAASFTNLRA